MEIIRNLNKEVHSALGNQTYISTSKHRKNNHICEIKYKGVVLWYHTLTNQMIALSEKELKSPDQELMKFFVNNWFYIPENIDERTLVYSARQLIKTRIDSKQNPGIDGYIIFTTTDCNARCFYCYELGRNRVPMSEEVALKTAKFIEENRGNNIVRLSWFGGEPLFNSKVIDTICDYLAAKDIPYKSSMISNGYLFNEHSANKITGLWHLKSVQITLDGTEKLYNSSKNFIYKDKESPFERVLKNIEYLLNIDIRVSVRINLSNENLDDIDNLIALLEKRFSNKKNFSAYAHPIFNDENQMKKEDYEKLCLECARVERELYKHGLSLGNQLNRFRIYHCMADGDRSVCVTPKGEFTLCEHHSEDEIVGNLDTGIKNQDVADSWKKLIDEKEECKTCFYYPQCLKLEKCITGHECDYGMKVFWEQNTKDSMVQIYEKYKENQKSIEDTTSKKKTLIRNESAVKRLIDAATAEVGYSVPDNNTKYIVETFQGDKYKPWCMTMINWLFSQCFGVSNARRMLFQSKAFTNYCYMVQEKFRDAGRIFKTPEVGDLVFFRINDWTDHVGLVKEVKKTGFMAISGNVKIEDGMNAVVEVEYSFDDETIIGYGRPDWRIADV